MWWAVLGWSGCLKSSIFFRTFVGSSLLLKLIDRTNTLQTACVGVPVSHLGPHIYTPNSVCWRTGLSFGATHIHSEQCVLAYQSLIWSHTYTLQTVCVGVPVSHVGPRMPVEGRVFYWFPLQGVSAPAFVQQAEQNQLSAACTHMGFQV